MAMLIAQSSPAVVAAPVLDADDRPKTTGPVSVAVVRDGATIATIDAVLVDGHVWSVALTGTHTAVLGPLVLVWPDARQVVDVVESLPVTRSMVRTSVRSDDPIADPARVPSWRLDRQIAAAVDELCEIVGVSVVVRRSVDRHVVSVADEPVRLHWCRWRSTLRALVSVSVDGVAMSSGDVAALRVDGAGRISGRWPAGAVITATYDHGDPTILTAELLEALIRRIRHRVHTAASALPERSERSHTDAEGRTVWLASPGMRHTGILDVDAVYHRHIERHGLTA